MCLELAKLIFFLRQSASWLMSNAYDNFFFVAIICCEASISDNKSIFCDVDCGGLAGGGNDDGNVLAIVSRDVFDDCVSDCDSDGLTGW